MRDALDVALRIFRAEIKNATQETAAARNALFFYMRRGAAARARKECNDSASEGALAPLVSYLLNSFL